MRIGVPKESLRNEHRVGLNPFGASRLVNFGHEIYVEHDAGKDCHFTDQDYAEVGVKVVYSKDEVYQRADIVARVEPLFGDEIDMLRPQSVVCGFHHLAVRSREELLRLIDKGVTIIGYEIVGCGGQRPVLTPLSEIAGQMAVHTAAHLLEYNSGGRGVVLGAVPGIPPSTVVIIGAGTAGQAAARMAQAAGAHVIVLDADAGRLRQTHFALDGRVATAVASVRNLRRFTSIADVLIGAVLLPGGRSPYVVTEEMVEGMKPGSVILDLSIDQGGCVETSRPTTIESPTFSLHGVTHYCVPNMTSAVPRTASRALTIAALPFLTRLAEHGVDIALAENESLACGVYLYRGHVINEYVAQTLGIEAKRLSSVIARS